MSFMVGIGVVYHVGLLRRATLHRRANEGGVFRVADSAECVRVVLELGDDLVRAVVGPVGVQVRRQVEVVTRYFRLFVTGDDRPAVVCFRRVVVKDVLMEVDRLRVLHSRVSADQYEREGLDLAFYAAFNYGRSGAVNAACAGCDHD